MMKEILEHMNHEHKDVLPLYEEVKVKLTKKTKLEDLHMELVKMAKMAREALGIPREVPCKHAEEK